MNVAATDTTRGLPTTEGALPINHRGRELDVKMWAAHRLLPIHGNWAIQFNAGNVVRIVLGIRDNSRGWYTAHFANLAATRLGLPFGRMRVYYSGTLPAVLQTPQECRLLSKGSQPGSFATAVGEVIDAMCSKVIENGRATFAALSGVDPSSVGFDPTSGCFFVRGGTKRASLLEIAGIANESRLQSAA